MMEKSFEITKDLLEKLQKVELEMLIEVDRICRKNNIKYSIMYGTLLGAVRNGGFIPWDDDCDVVFKRDEYEKFFEACKKDLDTSKFFLQEHRTDPNYLFGYGKLRKKNTVFRRKGQGHIKQRDGIFMDLFIYDNIPDGTIRRLLNKFELYVIRNALNSKIFKYTSYSWFKRLFYRMLDLIPKDRLFDRLDRIQKKYNEKDTELSRIYTWGIEDNAFFGYPNKLYDDLCELEFEGHKFLATKYFKEQLIISYGKDYMQMPPEEERYPHNHASEISFGDIFDQ